MLLALILAVFLAASGWTSVYLVRQTSGWRRWLAPPSGFLVMIGALAFFGAALSSVGALNWLPAFEWPAGRPDSALIASDGSHIVLLRGPGRVQLYDPRWRFVRGWTVGNGLKLRLLADGNVEVLTKGEQGLVFDHDGKLVARHKYGVQESVDLQNSLPPQAAVLVPTPPWLYIFSSPLLSGLAMLAGMLGWLLIWPKRDRD